MTQAELKHLAVALVEMMQPSATEHSTWREIVSLETCGGLLSAEISRIVMDETIDRFHKLSELLEINVLRGGFSLHCQCCNAGIWGFVAVVIYFNCGCFVCIPDFCPKYR